MGFIVKFDFSLNFWELHPQFKATEPFKEIYSKDKSSKKTDSSNIMWFISFCYDMDTRNIFRNEKLSEKHRVMGRDIFKESDYYSKNQKLLDSLIPVYIQLTTTQEQRHYLQWVNLLEERSAFLQTQKYSLDNYESLDKMAASTEKVFLTIKKIKDAISTEEKSKGSGKGDKELSISDIGLI